MSYESPSVQDTRIDIGALLGAVVRRLPRIILVTLALVAAAYVLLMFSPRLYESTASILVEPRGNIYTRGTNEQAPTLSGNEAGVVSSQIELIKSRDTLLRVIDRLDLRSVSEFNGSGDGGFSPLGVLSQILGRKAAPVSIDEIVLNNLYDAMTVSQARDSRIVSVVVSSTDPQRAAEIANAVANAHVTRRAELSLSDTATASGWLGTEIERLRVVVNEAETAVANFKVNNDLFIGSSNTSLPDQQMSTIASQISAAQERQNSAASRAALIRGMLERGQSIESVPDVRNSAVIQRLGEDKARLQGERAQRSATLLANHPTIRALNAQIAELDNQIAIEGRRVADALDAEAQIEADLQVSLQANLSDAKTTASTATQDTVTLDGLEREAKAQRDLLEGYLQRYNEAFSRTETNSALPDVRVVSVAAPSVSPASPKVQLVLVAVGIVSIMLQIGLIAFSELISGRAIVTARQPERPQDELDEVPFLEEELEPDQRWEEPAVEASVAEELPEPSFAEPVILAPVVDLAESRSQDEMDIIPGEDFDASDAPVQSSHVQPIPVAPIEGETGLTTMAELSSDLVYGRTHLLVLAAHSASADCEEVAEELIGEALSRGLSVALVDAGSGRIGEEPGLSDLGAGRASFGDVVQKSADNSFAEIAWGQLDAIPADSDKPLTLVQALSDIYEVVIVLTGEVGSNSTLPMFEGLDSRLVLVAGDSDDFGAVSACREQLRGLGYKHVDIAAVPARVAA
ncbi:GumC family protein [Devosia naphthalenivorans]|uniref:GumC family protein n=1 Tax=Devosia naphthalenivorans TaxID=2082392 RepID=UPI000D3AD65D|nr:GumC family protein [Devosia naphthalenivorans]